jgi:hypothetical protein
MTIVVFLGPSLPLAEARERLDAIFLPPAAQGDVWRVVTALRPRAIGLVDGVFRHTPSVWHKEILFALSQGIHVLGAASMGALRAAELAAFGMRGVGLVFEAYRDGRLAVDGTAPFEGDDEVAVIHAPAEAGWQPLSEAMVDIRCTLAAARRAGIVDEGERRLLAETAKAVFFAERAWPLVLDRAEAAGLAPARRAALAAWLGTGRVPQKRADAGLLLDELRRLREARPPPFRPAFRFAHTTMWELAVAEAGRGRPGEARGSGPLAVLDELRLDPPSWRAVRRAALLDQLATAPPAGPGLDPDPDDVRAATAELREAMGLADRRAIEAWAAANEVPAGHLRRLAEAEARLRRLERRLAPQLPARMLDRLRAEGRYAGLRRRAEAKAAFRLSEAAADGDEAAADDVHILRWYFARRLGRDIPDDLEAFARDLGFADAEGLCRALRLECRFVLAEGLALAGGDGGSDAPR